MPMRGCWKHTLGTADDAEAIDETFIPRVKHDAKSRKRSRLLERTISTHTTPRSVSALLEEAFVNVEFLETSPSDRPAISRTNEARPLLLKLNSVVSNRELQWTQSRKILEDALQLGQERREGLNASDGGFMGEGERLAERLDKLQLEMLHMAGDGNCQFRSVSNELFDTQDHHLHVRKRAVAHIREHKADYECFLGEDFEAYTAQMARNATWGDELTLRAICDTFGITVHVVTSEAEHWYLKYEPQQQHSSSALGPEIFLTYIAPIHYNAIRRRSALSSLKQRTVSGLQRISSGSYRGSTPSSRSSSKGSSRASGRLLSDDDDNGSGEDEQEGAAGQHEVAADSARPHSNAVR